MLWVVILSDFTVVGLGDSGMVEIRVPIFEIFAMWPGDVGRLRLAFLLEPSLGHPVEKEQTVAISVVLTC